MFALDADTGKAVDPGRFLPILANAIRSQYKLSASISDPIAWAKETEEARASFAQWQEKERLGPFARK
jgi:hypothetical protein